MLLALSGVTGIGKSYFKERLVEELNFHKVNTIRTRPIRIGEKNGVDGIFITDSELDELKEQNKIVYDFKVFGGRYAVPFYLNMSGYLESYVPSDNTMSLLYLLICCYSNFAVELAFYIKTESKYFLMIIWFLKCIIQ